MKEVKVGKYLVKVGQIIDLLVENVSITAKVLELRMIDVYHPWAKVQNIVGAETHWVGLNNWTEHIEERKVPAPKQHFVTMNTAQVHHSENLNEFL